MNDKTLAAKAAFLAGEARLDADAFRENTVYNADGDAIRLIANAERLEQYADTIEVQATRIKALDAEKARLREALTNLLHLDQRCGWHSKEADAAKQALAGDTNHG